MIRITRFLVACLCVALLLWTFPMISHAAEVNLPKTGQTTCYDASGNVIDCENTGQDGDVQAGVSWQEPRFVDNGDGTVTDHLTGLIWLKNANCFGTRTWAQALSVCNTLAGGACGLSDGSVSGDWRLPNVVELESLVNAGASSPASWLNAQGFTGVQSYNYWSGSTTVRYTNRAWIVGMDNGRVSDGGNKDAFRPVWPVRGW